jgi:hypothetical protein
MSRFKHALFLPCRYSLRFAKVHRSRSRQSWWTHWCWAVRRFSPALAFVPTQAPFRDNSALCGGWDAVTCLGYRGFGTRVLRELPTIGVEHSAHGLSFRLPGRIFLLCSPSALWGPLPVHSALIRLRALPIDGLRAQRELYPRPSAHRVLDVPGSDVSDAHLPGRGARVAYRSWSHLSEADAVGAS